MKKNKVRLSFRRKNPKSLAKGTGGMNACWRPTKEATKEDLMEYHKEDMDIRRVKQRAIKSTFMWPITKNNSPEYRKN